MTVRVTDSGGELFDQNFNIAIDDVVEHHQPDAWSDPSFVLSCSGSSDFFLPANALNVWAMGKSNVKLFGNALANAITGNAGRNTINGGGGNDKLAGGLGNDILIGSQGSDTFVFNAKPNKNTNLDKIADFNVKDDTIWLDNAIFKKLGKGSEYKPTKANKKFFTVGDKAKDSNDYIIYNKTKGVLYYDSDGSGSGSAVIVATLTKKLSLTYKDFLIV